MLKAFVLSFILHAVLLGALIWSTQLSLLYLKQRQRDLDTMGILPVEILYKPTETKVAKGQSPQDLPPPKVKTKTTAESDPAPVVKASPKKEKPKEKKKEEPKKDFNALFSKLRQETGEEARRAPRDDNLIKREDGEEGSRGTGGTAAIEMSPAHLAFQTAVRGHFEMPEKDKFKRNHPQAEAYLAVKLVGISGGFDIVSLQTTQPSGFPILDRNCEEAVIRTVQREAFASDVIQELSGKETLLKCTP